MLAVLAAILLTLAVVGGGTLATRRIRGRGVAFMYGLAHGGLATAGIVLLGLAAILASQSALVNAALLLFCLALVGGLFLLIFRLQREPPPGFMIALHGATAVFALVLLWAGILLGD